jgi:hypothetical protein
MQMELLFDVLPTNGNDYWTSGVGKCESLNLSSMLIGPHINTNSTHSDETQQSCSGDAAVVVWDIMIKFKQIEQI